MFGRAEVWKSSISLLEVGRAWNDIAAPGELVVSTSNRNFRGKQGAGDTYLASPETAVASGILGYIAPVSDLEGRK